LSTLIVFFGFSGSLHRFFTETIQRFLASVVALLT